MHQPAPDQVPTTTPCGYSVLGKAGAFDGTVAAPTGPFLVQGKYNEFTIDPQDFAIYDYAFTGAANPLDITGGQRPGVYASKVPDHPGLVLTSPITLEIKEDGVEIGRSGTGGLSRNIQAKDCANGGIFQMEPERGDGIRTRIVHRLAAGAFYFDNANFRAHLGEFLGSECTRTVTGVVQVRRPRQRPGSHPDPAGRVRAGLHQHHRTERNPRPLRRHVHLGRRQRRSHGDGHRRGRHRGGQSADDLHAPVPGAEPGAGPVGEPRVPVPGAHRKPTVPPRFRCRVWTHR